MLNGSNNIIFKILLSECDNCQNVEEKTMYYFYQKDISRLLLIELGKHLSYLIFKVENENNLSEENLNYIEYLKYISKKHLENGRTDGKTLTETIILPELVKEGNELFYNFTKTFSGEKFSLDFIIAFKKELENARKFEKKRFMLTNIYNILSEFLYVEERKKQEKNINLFLRKLGNIFINYSYESAINFIGDEDEEEEQKEIIVSLDFRDRNLLNATIEKLTSTSSLNNIYSSGFKNFDNRFLNGGFEAGRLYVFAGKPGQGKSALLLNFAYNCALKESDRGSVIYITLENSVEETLNRLLKIIIYDETNDREAYKEYKKDKQKIKDIILRYFADKNFKIKYFQPNFCTSDLLSWIATIHQRERISIIFIDYLSLLTSTKAYEQKRHELGQITLELKKMARLFSVPIVTAAQLNSAGYDTIPTMKNIDESRQVAQHADFIGLLFDAKETATNLDDCQMVIGINVDKNRNGPRGIAKFVFDTLVMKFNEYGKGSDKLMVADDEEIMQVIKETKEEIIEENYSEYSDDDPFKKV